MAPTLVRALGFFDTLCVVVGGIVGVGIFFTPKTVANLVATPTQAPLVWGFAAVVAYLGAISFAALGKRTDRSGGQYVILREAYGRAPAFLYVVCNLTLVQTGAVAIIASITAEYGAIAVLGHPLTNAAGVMVPVVLIAAIAIVNVLGVKAGAKVQNLTVVAKLAALLTLVLLAVGSDAAPPSTAPASTGTWTPSMLLAGLIPAMFAFGGWQQALWVGGEVKDAERTVPRAILLGVLVVAGVYLSVNWAFFALLGFDGVRNGQALAAEAVRRVVPAWGERAVAAAVTTSALGVLNAQFLTGPRLTQAMAADGLFFARFARVHHRFRTPAAAVLLLAGFASALLLALGKDRVDEITAGGVVVGGVFFALTTFSLWILHRRGARVSLLERLAGLLFAMAEIGAILALAQRDDFRKVVISALGAIGLAAVLYVARFRRVGSAPSG